MTEELIYRCGLSNIHGIGSITAKKLIDHFGSARSLFSASKKELIRVSQIGSSLALKIWDKKDFSLEAKELTTLEKKGIKILFFDDQEYPSRLKNQPDCPFMLQYLGNNILNHPRIISIVGTRNPTRYGVSQCEKIIEELKPYDVIITSGLAYGIDAVAHRAALKSDIPTLAVLGSGIGKIYPSDHIELAQKLTLSGGLLSQFSLNTSAEREHFPMRNSIVAGICDALVVIQSNVTGGSMITAGIANHYHKDVFALPGNVTDKYSQGCHHLIMNFKASIFQNGDDIAKFMNWDNNDLNTGGIQKSFFPDLDEEENLIVNLISNLESVKFDDLAGKIKKSPSKLIATLLQLELKGVIKTEPGNIYTLL